MTYKCKICGGQATIDSNNGVVVCNYCGTKQALPLFTADSERLLYDRGNNYLLQSEYDKAENVFNQLLTIKPGAAELYWDLVLCKYGVTYVKDPKTGKYIPTCNRTHYTPIFSDENYKKAIELSSGEKKALFEEDAKTIDNIQKGIIAVSKKEKPFDIFISYKETDANGNRTKESIEAQKLYEKLTEAGYKVFFSRITLEDKIGTEYEPYIYAALYSSKVMLTICSSRENIDAVWVKNEWSRFLGFRQNDNSKTLLPLYFDMDKADLPEEFALLSPYDMRVNGFEEELLRGIKKLIPLPIMKAKRRRQMVKATGIVVASLVMVAGIAAAIIIPKKMEERRISALEKANEAAYQTAMTLFDNADYTAAEAAFIALGEYKDAPDMAVRCTIQPNYDAAMQLYYDGKYAQATWAFEALGDYEDASVQKEKAKASWRKQVARVTISDDEYGYEIGYYINTNGSVDGLGYTNSSETPTINNHGEIISIADGWDGVFALHEDGFVDNLSKSDDIQWNEIIQVSDMFSSKCAILLANGKVAMAELVSNTDYGDIDDDMWLADVSDWENIVMLDYYAYSCEGIIDNILIGLDRDGNIHICYDEEDNTGYPYEVDVDVFKNCKTARITEGRGIVALTNDGRIIANWECEIPDSDYSDVIDIISTPESIYTLSRDGKLRSIKTGHAVLSDVIKIAGPHIITRSGAVYEMNNVYEMYYNEGVKLLGWKTQTHNEWLTRLD